MKNLNHQMMVMMIKEMIVVMIVMIIKVMILILIMLYHKGGMSLQVLVHLVFILIKIKLFKIY